MLMSDDYVPQRGEHALWRGHTAPSSIEHLQLLDPDYAWNSLPSHLKEADLSYDRFRRSLKTFLFGQWGHGTVWTILIASFRNNLTYLLTYLRCIFHALLRASQYWLQRRTSNTFALCDSWRSFFQAPNPCHLYIFKKSFVFHIERYQNLCR